MRNETRILFNSYVSQIALINGVPDATVQFTVAPVVQQTLLERIQQSSEFLSSINMPLVPDQEGQKVGIGVTRTMAGRTNTANNNRRQPTDPTDSAEVDTYRCEKTDFDWAIPYAKLDAWRHKPEFETILRDAILKQQGRDTIMIGWNGTSVAPQTDRAANPLLQDVEVVTRVGVGGAADLAQRLGFQHQARGGGEPVELEGLEEVGENAVVEPRGGSQAS